MRRAAGPSRSVAARPARAGLALLAGLGAAAAGAGCTVVTVRYGHAVPDARALAAVVPGTSTRADVVAALGAPEEYASPNALAFARAWDPPRQRVDAERDLIGRRVLTWLHETRTRREFAVLPSVPLLGGLATLFSYATVVHEDERVVVLLDEDDVVTAVGRSREDGS
jgi:hypothetical protein